MSWTGVILAGGRSSRMGRDKALLPWKGGTFLSRAENLLRGLVGDVIVSGG
ncbi:MAG: NTP transferase domain-containing protein, partial [Bdellovibrionales bacterium]|nr:NTP transferase domain-containing protein [Bdellovibrionales bacterium]